MITGTAAWILVVVMISANKAGNYIYVQSGYMTEEACLYEKDDALKKKSVEKAECILVGDSNGN